MRTKRSTADVGALVFHWRKLFWLAVGAMALLVGDSALLQFGPPAFVTALVRAWKNADMASVATGASFSVSAASFATEAKAATFAAALDASGLPILVRVRPDDRRYQVLVGPYVSTEEAEHAQRALAAWGFGESRFVVDDAMRSTTRASVFGTGEASNGVVLVSAPGMSSLVFEMANRPSNVEARRSSATTIDLIVGADDPQAGPAETLALPDGVSLIRDVSVQTAPGSGLRSRITVADGVESRLRLEGRRVYLDLAWPKTPWALRLGRASAASRAGAAGDADGAGNGSLAGPSATYGDQLAPIAARFDEIAPFLESAAQSPDTDVLAALGHSVGDVRQSLASIAMPAEQEANRQALLASLDRVSSAMSPSFSGDRVATVRDASLIWRSTARPGNP